MRLRREFCKILALFCMISVVLSSVVVPNTLVYGAANDMSLYEDVTEISDKSTILTRGNYLNYGAVTFT